VLHHVGFHAVIPPVGMFVVGVASSVRNIIIAVSRRASDFHVSFHAIDELFTKNSLAKGKCLLGDEASQVWQIRRPDLGIRWTESPKTRVDKDLDNPN
jgi:hypothetical protein